MVRIEVPDYLHRWELTIELHIDDLGNVILDENFNKELFTYYVGYFWDF